MKDPRQCSSCKGIGTLPTDYGPVDCPDCGGAGSLPPLDVHIEWRARDIEKGLAHGRMPDSADVKWLLAELRAAREALMSIVALAHDVEDDNAIAVRIRFTANRALGVAPVRTEP
jgi:hypothetical protein